MTDIVERLRDPIVCGEACGRALMVMDEAADEIEALRLSLLLLRGERDRLTDEKNAMLISRTLGQPC